MVTKFSLVLRHKTDTGYESSLAGQTLTLEERVWPARLAQNLTMLSAHA